MLAAGIALLLLTTSTTSAAPPVAGATAPVLLAQGATARYVIAVGYNGASGDERGQLEFADDDAARFYLAAKPGAAKAWLLTTFDTHGARAFGDRGVYFPHLFQKEGVAGRGFDRRIAEDRGDAHQFNIGVVVQEQ